MITIDIAQLKHALESKFKSINLVDFNEDEISDLVNEFIEDHYEKPAYEAAGIDYPAGDIYDAIDNVDELRDTQHDFIASLIKKSNVKKIIQQVDNTFKQSTAYFILDVSRCTYTQWVSGARGPSDSAVTAMQMMLFLEKNGLIDQYLEDRLDV